jgi:hypothetical protein
VLRYALGAVFALKRTQVRVQAHNTCTHYTLCSTYSNDSAMWLLHVIVTLFSPVRSAAAEQSQAIKQEAKLLERQHQAELRACIDAYITKLTADTLGE